MPSNCLEIEDSDSAFSAAACSQASLQEAWCARPHSNEPPTIADFVVKSENRALSLNQQKRASSRDSFLLVGDRGLEPPTSASQTRRASQLRQSPI